MRICYWNNIASPYLVERLNTIQARGNLEVVGLFNKWTNSHRSWKVEPDDLAFAHRFAPDNPLAVRRWLIDQDVDLLISIYSKRQQLVTLPLVIPRIPTILRVLPTYDTWVERTRSKELAKHALFRAVRGFKVPGPDGERLVRRYSRTGQIWRVPQTVPIDLFTPGPAQAAPRDRPLQLGYVGRLIPQKGVQDMLDALADPNLPESVLRVAGDGPMGDALPARVGSCTVERVGYLQRPEVPDFLRSLDVLLFPTHGDPFGLVVEESIATGLPVVSSSAAGDIASRVTERGVGVVYPWGDVAALTAAIATVADEGRRRSMAARTLEVRSELGHDRYAAAVEQMARDVLGG